MSNYVKATNFTAKDSLPSGNSGKIIKGAEIDTEFTAIASSVSSKADINSPTFTGTPAAPTAGSGSNTTQVANTAFVKAAIDDLNVGTLATQDADDVAITGGSIAGITDLAVADGGTGASTLTGVVIGNGTSAMTAVAPGTSGNVLTSDGTDWTSAAVPAVGVGQTWTVVTRTSGTTYTNDTGIPIFLIRSSRNSGSDTTGATISIDGGTAFYFSISGTDTGPSNSVGSVIIPVGATYVITDINAGTIQTVELR